MNGFNNGESYERGDLVSQKTKNEIIMHMIMKVIDDKYVLACRAFFEKKKKSIPIETTKGIIYIVPTNTYRIMLKKLNKTKIYIINSRDVVSNAYKIFCENVQKKRKLEMKKAKKEKAKKKHKHKKNSASKIKYSSKTHQRSSTTRTIYTVNNLYRPYQGGRCSGK